MQKAVAAAIVIKRADKYRTVPGSPPKVDVVVESEMFEK